MRSRSRTARLVVPVAVCVASAGAVTAFAAGPSTPSAAGPYAPGHVLVSYLPGVDAAQQASLERGNSATRISTIDAIRAVVLQVRDGAEQHVADALQRSGKVQYAELDGVATVDTTTPNDTYWRSQWGPQKVNAPTAWDTTTGSTAVVVGDVDTGIDFSHPDLQGKTVAGYDFVNNDSNPQDDNGHGTSTAGEIAATSNNSTGIAAMCWSCKIMPVKALNSSGSGTYSQIANGITWAADHGAQIINLSLGGSTDSSTLHNAVTYAHNKGVVLLAAAGNSGTTAYHYPAAYSETVSVAGTDSNDKLYSWSSYGSWVDVAAPGCDYATALGGGYNSSFCGTSAATPIVSGIAALAKSLGSGASNSSIESALESTAVKVGTFVKYGRVDAAAVLSALGGSATPTPATGSTTTTFNGSVSSRSPSQTFSVTAGSGTLSAQLTFSKATSLKLQLVSNGSVVAQSTGGSPVSLSTTVTGGAYSLVVSGTSQTKFSLTVSYPTP